MLYLFVHEDIDVTMVVKAISSLLRTECSEHGFSGDVVEEIASGCALESICVRVRLANSGLSRKLRGSLTA